MVEQVRRFDELTECGQDIVQYVDNEQAVQKITLQLERFQERWEGIVQQMERLSKKVSTELFPIVCGISGKIGTHCTTNGTVELV